MKKLMIVAMVAMAAIAANAQKITWGVTTGTALTGITAGTKYLVWSGSSTLDFSQLADQKSFSETTITSILKGTVVDSSEYSSSALNAQTVVKPGDPISSMTQGLQKFYSIIIAEGGKKLAYSAVSNVPIMNNETVTSIAKAGSTFTIADAAKDPEPTPEPTSAMLLLLGVAGLALRRKQK